jgi:hypothetical protein
MDHVATEDIAGTPTVAAPGSDRVHDVIRLIHSLRLPLSDETAYQVALSKVLDAAGIGHVREHRLGPKHRVDFLLDWGTVIEVKLRGSAMRIHDQCKDYCGFPQVKGLILATNRAMGMPPEIEGKPIWYASLGRGWL